MKHFKTSFMKLSLKVSIAILATLFSNCRKNDFPPPVRYSADVANAWMQLQIKLTKTTAGYNSVVSDRSFGYAGIALYEALVAGVPGNKSLLSQIGGSPIIPEKDRSQYFWPASVNAAMATITKDFFATTTPANMITIDSLEAAFTTQFQNEAGAEKIQNAVDYGHKVAASIFEWSKTDGGDEAFKHINMPSKQFALVHWIIY